MRQVTIDTMTEMWTIKDYRTIFNNEQTYAIQGPGITNVKKIQRRKTISNHDQIQAMRGPGIKKWNEKNNFLMYNTTMNH